MCKPPIDRSEARTRQVMLWAQIDMTAMMRYILGLEDHYPDMRASQKTLEALHELTGDEVGSDLMHRELEIG